jgi:hypothetical protein
VLKDGNGDQSSSSLVDSVFHAPTSMVWDSYSHCIWAFDHHDGRLVFKCILLVSTARLQIEITDTPGLDRLPPGLAPIIVSYADIGCGSVKIVEIGDHARNFTGHELMRMDYGKMDIIMMDRRRIFTRFHTATLAFSYVPDPSLTERVVAVTPYGSEHLLQFTKENGEGYLKVYKVNTSDGSREFVRGEFGHEPSVYTDVATISPCVVFTDLTNILRMTALVFDKQEHLDKGAIRTLGNYIHLGRGERFNASEFERSVEISSPYRLGTCGGRVYLFSSLGSREILNKGQMSPETPFFDGYKAMVSNVSRTPIVALDSDRVFFFSGTKLICSILP